MQVAPPSDQASVPAERRAGVRAELARILSSHAFRGSRRCCGFLEYSVQHVLRGNGQEELRERTIGVEVFHRPPDYDTADDAIVRVTANEVRKRLAQYYQEVGDRSDLTIALEPGSYAVAVRWKTEVAEPPPAARGRRWKPVIAAACGLALLAASAYYAVRSRERPAVSDPVWSRVFRSGQKTNIVMADATRYEIQELLLTDLRLKDYLSADYPSALARSQNPELQRVIRFMGTRQTTSVASVATGSLLLEFGRRHGVNPVLRHPRHVNVREFKTDNFILLGSRMSIPWVELFEPRMDFLLKIDSATRDGYLENRSPRTGEQPRYVRSDDLTWADLAVLPNVDGTGTVLILNAIDMPGVEAGCEFAMRGSLAGILGGNNGEVLLRVRSIGGTASKAEVAAVRILTR